jgi:hypothetical protein
VTYDTTTSPWTSNGVITANFPVYFEGGLAYNRQDGQIYISGEGYYGQTNWNGVNPTNLGGLMMQFKADGKLTTSYATMLAMKMNPATGNITPLLLYDLAYPNTCGAGSVQFLNNNWNVLYQQWNYGGLPGGWGFTNNLVGYSLVATNTAVSESATGQTFIASAYIPTLAVDSLNPNGVTYAGDADFTSLVLGQPMSLGQYNNGNGPYLSTPLIVLQDKWTTFPIDTNSIESWAGNMVLSTYINHNIQLNAALGNLNLFGNGNWAWFLGTGGGLENGYSSGQLRMDTGGNVFETGNVAVTGNVTANSFTGNLNACQITSGTVPPAALPGGLALLSSNNAANLTNIPASQLTDTLPIAQLPSYLASLVWHQSGVPTLSLDAGSNSAVAIPSAGVGFASLAGNSDLYGSILLTNGRVRGTNRAWSVLFTNTFAYPFQTPPVVMLSLGTSSASSLPDLVAHADPTAIIAAPSTTNFVVVETGAGLPLLPNAVYNITYIVRGQ